ncbi:efflux transporter outer membrane subunit [Dyella koreensis]|uniref:Efflux transporter outer membrane subunit n=1 Tax=Dyella koreensis TaxID=311235 RepID=A0ABW8JYC2_9GAMM
MRLHTMAAAIGLTLALAGCVSSGGIHPSGSLMEASSLKSEHSLDGITVSPAAWPQQDWWTALGDAQLDSLIAEALRDNPSLAAADARAQQAQAAAGVADAQRGPTVNGGASVAGARLPPALSPGGDSHFSLAKYGYASFNWGLDLWGGKRAAWEAALGQARAAEIDRQAARIELSTNVARAYTQLGYAYAQQDVAKAELERANRARDLTRQRVSAGIDSQLQLKQSDSEVATAEQQQVVATRAIDAARSSLSVLLGKGPDRGLDLARPQVLKPTALTVPGNLSMDLIGHRADLVAARWRVEAASKDIKVAKTEFLPNVSIGAMAGLLNMGGGNLFTLKNRFYELGPSVSLPIFDGGRLRANLAGKDAQYDLAVAQYNQTLVAATNQVADDYNALQSVQQQIEAQQRALDAATQAWQLSDQRYKAGIGNYLEALIVRQQLLQAQQRMAALQSQQVDLSVQLIQALGGGYRPQAEAHEVAAASTSSVSERSL